MTPNVVTVFPETPLIKAVNILLKHNFNGLPVVDKNNKLIGILTEYDLIIKGTSIHLPTFIRLFNELDLYKRDSGLIKDDLKKILELKVGDVMNKEPLYLKEDDSIFKVVDSFSQYHSVNPIPIINEQGVLTGVISRYDLLKFMGDKDVDIKEEPNQEDIEKSINSFINNFDKKFILVSKGRTRFWLIMSILFAVLGFAVAFALILRVNF